MNEQVAYTPEAFDALLVPEASASAPVVDETPAETPVEVTDEAETPAEAKARDEKGRFAAKEKPAEEPAAEAKPAEEPKKAKPRDDPQARIDQVIARQKDAERRADAAEARARELEAKVAAPPLEPVKPERFPTYQSYLQTKPDASLEDYMDARDEWRDAQKETTRRTQAAEQARLTAHQTRVATFSERMKDADQATLQAIDPRLLSATPLSALSPAEQRTATFGNFLADLVLKSEHPKDVLLHLSDPSVVQRLATLPPDDVIRDLARFEARLDAAPAPSEPRGPAKETKPAVSQTQKPIRPLGSSPQAPDPHEITDDIPVEEFIRRRNAADRARR